jgi:hypothetical protein
VVGTTVFCLDREAKPRQLAIDPSEYTFKLALAQRRYDAVLSMIRSRTLCGEAIISYLQASARAAWLLPLPEAVAGETLGPEPGLRDAPGWQMAAASWGGSPPPPCTLTLQLAVLEPAPPPRLLNSKP